MASVVCVGRNLRTTFIFFYVAHSLSRYGWRWPLYWVSLISVICPPYMNVSVSRILELKPIGLSPSMPFGGYEEPGML